MADHRRVLWVVESMRPDGSVGPVDGEPLQDVAKTRRDEAREKAYTFACEDEDENRSLLEALA